MVCLVLAAAILPGRIKTSDEYYLSSIIVSNNLCIFVGTICFIFAFVLYNLPQYDYFKSLGFLFKDTFKWYLINQLKCLKFKYHHQNQPSIFLENCIVSTSFTWE